MSHLSSGNKTDRGREYTRISPVNQEVAANRTAAFTNGYAKACKAGLALFPDLYQPAPVISESRNIANTVMSIAASAVETNVPEPQQLVRPTPTAVEDGVDPLAAARAQVEASYA